jgi:hypothetical protein
MKKSILFGSLLALLISVTTAYAEAIKLEDNTTILGKWNLYAEAAALHKEQKAVNIVWEFKKNGILNASATDTRGRTGAMSINLKYSIEAGAIKKQSSPGREKYELCKVIKQEGKEMVLKCKYLYFFLRRA